MFERLLERISLSSYRDKLILKGGLLIAAMVGIDTRSTMDMDVTIRGIPLSEKTLAEKKGSYSYLLETGYDIIGEIEQSQVLTDLWRRYQQKNSYADDLVLKQVINSVKIIYNKAFDI